MTYFYLLLNMFFSAAITIGGRIYSNRTKSLANVSILYTMIVPAFAALGWLALWCFDFSFDIKVLPYAFLYGIGYSFFTVGILGALKVGLTSLTALVKQMALVGVSIWGFVFWDTQFTLLSGIGLVLIVLSLVLCLITKEKGTGSGNLLKWAFYAVLITVGNAGCAIIQRYQQMAFDYQHKNQFMFFGVLFAAAVCALLSLKEDKQNWGKAWKVSWPCLIFTGISSAATNVCMLLLVQHQMSPVILYPGVAVGGLMFTTLTALVFFREKLRVMQWWGLGVGAVALILLNL